MKTIIQENSTSRNCKIIKERIDRNSRISVRQFAYETGINCNSARKMTKNKLALKLYKLQKVQLLMNENKSVWLQRCLQVRHQAADQESSSPTRSYSWCNGSTIAKMTETVCLSHRQNPKCQNLKSMIISVTRHLSFK